MGLASVNRWIWATACFCIEIINTWGKQESAPPNTIVFITDDQSPLTYNDLFAIVDIAPTLLDIAGVEPPDNYGSDGQSFAGLLRGRTVTAPRSSLYAEISYSRAVLTDDNPNYFDSDQLYDLNADPKESNNLFGSNHPQEERLRQLLKTKLQPFPVRLFGEFTQ